jgi:hypothetical protein
MSLTTPELFPEVADSVTCNGYGDCVSLLREPDAANPHVRLCDQERLARSVGDRPTEVKVRSLVAWIAGRREIEFPKPIDKAIFRMVSKSSGRNESERRCGLESEKPQGLSLQPKGESSMDRRRLTDAAVFTLAG